MLSPALDQAELFHRVYHRCPWQLDEGGFSNYILVDMLVNASSGHMFLFASDLE
jgi:hypothetical protein